MAREDLSIRTVFREAGYQRDVLALDPGRTAIGEPLRVVWEYEAFQHPQDAHVAVSPHQYQVICRSGPLHGFLDQEIGWPTVDYLPSALHHCWIQGMDGGEDRPPKWRELVTPFFFGHFLQPLFLAEQAVLGIRGSAGLVCQEFARGGWPVAAPFTLEGDVQELGLFVSAALIPSLVPELPFTRQMAEAAIPETLRNRVKLDWHEVDDLIAPVRHDPQCVLQPENLHHWLDLG